MPRLMDFIRPGIPAAASLFAMTNESEQIEANYSLAWLDRPYIRAIDLADLITLAVNLSSIEQELGLQLIWLDYTHDNRAGTTPVYNYAADMPRSTPGYRRG